MRVETTAIGGRVVWFDAFMPAVRINQRPADPSKAADRVILFVTACTTVLVWVGAGLLARRNLRHGRGDRQGAFRSSVCLTTTLLLATTIGAHHAADFVEEVGLMRMLLAFTLYIGASVWLMYMAIEPYLRRIWPEVLIGWSRILTGRFRDPRVGRDILVGTCAGMLITLITQLLALTSRWFGVPGALFGLSVVGLPPGQLVVGARDGLGFMLSVLALATFVVLVNTVFLVFLRALFRSRIAAALALTALFGANILAVVTPPDVRGVECVFPIASVILAAAISVIVLVRFGALSAFATQWVIFLTSAVPITFDWSKPYAESSWLIVGTILALTIYGFRTTLAGRSIAVIRQPQL